MGGGATSALGGEVTNTSTGRRRFGTAAIGVFLMVTGCSITEAAPDVIARRSDAVVTTTLPDDPFVETEADDTADPEPDVAEPPPDPEPVDDTVPDPELDDVSTSEPTDGGSRTPSPPSEPAPEPGGGLGDDEVDAIVEELIANGFCDSRDFDDDGAVTAIHFVLGGVLQDPCFVAQPDSGVDDVVFDNDPRLIAAWDELIAVTPTSFVDDISLLAGFEACRFCDTLAFVTTLDVAGEFFVIAVDVVAGAADPDELRLTMLHELTHVFTQDPRDQLDLQGQVAPCDTYFNGNGCFTEDSYMWAWIQEFWTADFLATLPPDGGFGSDDDSFARCDANADFVGSYAASHPEEDFAETFSAWVFDVEVAPELADKYAFFERYPELVEIRDNARAAGLAGATDDNFEGCGL